MLDIKNMSQEEIEQAFSRQSIVDTLALECDMFYTQMEDEDIKIAQDIIGVEDVYEFMVHFIAMIGDPSRDIQGKRGIHHRQIEVEALIKALSTNKQLTEIFRDYETRMNISMKLVGEYDTILYDIAHKTIRTEYGDFYNLVVANVEFSLDLSVAVLPKFEGFPLPMIETPKEWIVGESGGYKTSTSKCTLNKGAKDQPQEVLDILNTLQSNKFIMSENTNIDSHYTYVLEKMKKSYSYNHAKELALNLVSTTTQVYDVMKDVPFYFEWKYDFRGRLYSTGYDLNLQSDKYHKGAIVPLNN